MMCVGDTVGSVAMNSSVLVHLAGVLERSLYGQRREDGARLADSMIVLVENIR